MIKAKKESFSHLLREVRVCDICHTTLPLGPRPIVQLDPQACILIAGQAPGKKVHMTGVPFDDPSGDRLRDWLGVDRGTFYDASRIAILPMGFCYPGTGKSGDLSPRPECAEAWRARLLGQMPNIRLTLVIGQYAHEYHLRDSPHKTVTGAVQAWTHFWPERLPLPHPSPRNNIWLKRNPWFEKEVLPPLKKRIHDLVGS